MIIKIGKNEYSLEKPKLKQWVHLEELRNKVIHATEVSNSTEFLENYYSLISVALGIPVQELYDATWYDLAIAYLSICELQLSKYEFPMLYVKSKPGAVDWEYPGRTWFIWVHTLSKTYGWSIEYISELDPDDAIALLHEILSDEYYAKEWQWGLSEVAYSYDSNTKSSKYKGLPKPEWMKVRTNKEVELPKVKIKKSMLPSGVVVHWKEDEDA